MRAQQALTEAVAVLRGAGVADAGRDARLLLAQALGIAAERVNMILHDDMPDAAHLRLGALVQIRASRVPMAQILGERLFWGRAFKVTRDTLDPRPETEILVAEALTRPFSRMLDLGTGTGCILISCLLGMPQAVGVGVDISPEALQVAAQNARTHGAKASFLESDWFARVEGRFDLIVSNPPYIAADEMADLAPEVRDHEPHLALTPGGDGLQPYRIIARAAPARLMAGGRLMVEIGPTQGAAVLRLFAAEGLKPIRILQDWDQRDRVVIAEKPALERDFDATLG
ncbi:peptide chain release factor N(5)-glutamine methyltransferase [Rhodobacter sp. KR11]|uniref:peptide chain release factor N(5)-glutamine methyltransferase n=1 Tax=Rhodobacter sp. KR11 TaxID=2974588 RepID=UPI00222133C3|nr:peptide chain release factor N(5)-glutamine methyltransferase [Rhodobacter sp. KR11]MCW1919403.1 peptide chain release factor N(5)-glutamine methyltransferase [Rhodobacter sp. KR11]